MEHHTHNQGPGNVNVTLLPLCFCGKPYAADIHTSGTLKKRFEKEFSQGDDIGYFGFKLETRFSDVQAFFRQELLALAEEVENRKQPENVKYNNGLAVAAALIRNRANELV